MNINTVAYYQDRAQLLLKLRDGLQTTADELQKDNQRLRLLLVEADRILSMYIATIGLPRPEMVDLVGIDTQALELLPKLRDESR